MRALKSKKPETSIQIDLIFIMYASLLIFMVLLQFFNMLTNEFFKLNKNTNGKNKPPMLQTGNSGKSRDVCDLPALFLTNNHAILKCLLASYSTVKIK